MSSSSSFRVLLPFGMMLCLATSGCCPDAYITSSCGARPAGQIEGFDLTLRTGSDGTDADIFFCYSQIDSRVDTCFLLDDAANNFETGLTDSFRLTSSFASESFDTFWVENRGGGFLGESGWDIDAISVSMRTATGSTLLYSESNIVCNEAVDEAETYMPGGCIWE